MQFCVPVGYEIMETSLRPLETQGRNPAFKETKRKLYSYSEWGFTLFECMPQRATGASFQRLMEKMV